MEKIKKANILIVDDSLNKQNMLECILSPLDENLVKLDSGKQALRYLLVNEAAVIILDVQMPEMDGFETAAMIRKRGKNEFTPIIFVTAYSTADKEIARGYEMGAVDYMFTPVIPEILKSKVKVLLDLYRMNHALKSKNEELENTYASIQSLNLNLEEKALQLELVNRELESFSYSVSHDLRAPLHAIKGFAAYLQDTFSDSLPEEGKQLITSIRANVEKMNRLIQGLLDLSRFGRRAINLQEIDFNSLVDEMISEIQKTCPDHPVVLDREDLPAVSADETLIRQVWTNLLSNAVKFSKNQKESRIRIKCLKSENELIFSTTDNGVGFNPAYTDKLFGVFQRLHSDSEFEGTGIGLAIVQRIIAKHNGKIWAESSPGKGATFSFSLPISAKTYI